MEKEKPQQKGKLVKKEKPTQKDMSRILKMVARILIVMFLGIFIVSTTIVLINKIGDNDGDTLQSLLPVYSLLVGSAIAGLISIAVNSKKEVSNK